MFSRYSHISHFRQRSAAVAVAVLAVAGLLVSAPPATAEQLTGAGQPPPSVWPRPQSMVPTGHEFQLPPAVGVVSDRRTDQPALRLVRQALRAAGAIVFDVPKPADGVFLPAIVYVGGPTENDASAAALSRLGAAGPDGLPSGGYVLATARTGIHSVVVVAGVDATGTFYAAQTFRQLLRPRSPVPGVVVRDWPALPLRGVIEGFYGPPWSESDRLAQLDFLARTRQNTYVYSPKDDPYLRAQWRDAYPAGQLAILRRLVERAWQDHVRFTFALSPGLSVCYSSAADEKALVAKLQSMWDVGVRSFSVPLDDISLTAFNCAADTETFGSGEAAAAVAQSFLLNKVQHDFIATHPGAERLQMVPTAYAAITERPYRAALRTHLDKAVITGWTGVGVVAPTISTAQAQAATAVFGHDVLLWDNYPVNDYVTDRLLLGPYVGREPGIGHVLAGITANPMIECAPSRIAEFTSADFAWNPDAYVPEQSWKAALADIGGPVAGALSVFADNSRSSTLDPAESPELTGLIDRFWTSWPGAGWRRPTADLRAYFVRMAAAPGQLSDRLADRAFVEESRTWLAKLGLYGAAGRTAVDLLTAVRSGDSARAAAARVLLARQRADLRTMPQQLAVGVMDPFLDRVAVA